MGRGKKKGDIFWEKGNEVLQCITDLAKPGNKGILNFVDHELTAIK